jgi:prepilin-type N-terminal cleavage/methylation domain-containing protein
VIQHRDAMHTARRLKTCRRVHFSHLALPAFTLIELVVVLTIVSILASLTLAGLAGTRQRAKIDKTKSTIRKLHELIVPHYETYLRRRVKMAGTSGPAGRLIRTRQLVMFEMPDSWSDVPVGDPSNPKLLRSTQSDGSIVNSGFVSDHAWNGVTQGYASYYESLRLLRGNELFRQQFPSSECLYMIVSRGLGEPDLMEQFRSDEIGDVDDDKAPEFIDGWGQPIAFIRWPVGFSSPIQSQNAALQPDPFDPFNVSAAMAYPATLQRDYAVTPLIVSGGPDGAFSQFGVAFSPLPGWHPALFGSPPSSLTLRSGHAPNEVPGQEKDAAVAADNITNHDLLAK